MSEIEKKQAIHITLSEDLLEDQGNLEKVIKEIESSTGESVDLSSKMVKYGLVRTRADHSQRRVLETIPGVVAVEADEVRHK